jgi:hypothetical protein
MTPSAKAFSRTMSRRDEPSCAAMLAPQREQR